MNFIRNIINIVISLSFVTFITIFTYIISLFCNRLTLIWFFTFFFKIFRSMMMFIMGLKIEYRGLENIPEGTCIFASKHQSFFESAFFFNQFKLKTVYAYKKEIHKVPLWKTLSKKFGGISVDRLTSISAVKKLLDETKYYIDQGYSICLFPEGERIAVGKEVKFKRSIYRMHRLTKVPIIPVALNTGCFYPRKSLFIKTNFKVKKIIIEFLPPIYEEEEENKFMNILQTSINTKTKELIQEII